MKKKTTAEKNFGLGIDKVHNAWYTTHIVTKNNQTQDVVFYHRREKYCITGKRGIVSAFSAVSVFGAEKDAGKKYVLP